LVDPGVDGDITLKWVLRGIRFDGVEGIHLARDRKNRRAVANTVMNLRVA
jgi:hypothetical protein